MIKRTLLVVGTLALCQMISRGWVDWMGIGVLLCLVIPVMKGLENI